MSRMDLSRVEFELHFAAEEGRVSESLRSRIYELGFRDDGLVGRGVVFSPGDLLGQVSCPLVGMHVTWQSFDRGAYLVKRGAIAALLDDHQGQAVGYAHGEVIRPSWDVELAHRPFQPGVRCPIERLRQALDRDRVKRWDIHVSARRSRLDERMEEVLFGQLGMYYIDVFKSGAEIYRVFTVQGTNSVHEGRRLFATLLEYLRQAGGIEGAIKYEQTCFWKTCGAPQIVPPTLRTISYLKEVGGRPGQPQMTHQCECGS
jgi:hypothetical protein